MADITFSQEKLGETRAWLERVHAEQEKRPATELFACFNRDLTISVVNQATQIIQQAFDWRSEGISQKIDKAQFRKAKCSLYLYYRVLQGVLLEKQHVLPEAAQDIVDDVNFTKSLLLVAVELVVLAWQGNDMVFPATTLRLQCLHLAFDMLAATALFRTHLGPAPGAADHGVPPTVMPVAAVEYMGFMRVRIIEELALLNGSTLFGLIGRLDDTEHAAGDVAEFEGFVQTYATMARERCFQQACTELAAVVPALAQAPGFEALAQQLLSHLMLEHFHVAFNQHQLNLVSCCVYSAARVLGAAVPFRRINETIALVFPLQDTALFVQANVGNADEVRLGDTRQMYNDVFLPPMENYLQALVAAHKDAVHMTPAAGAGAPIPNHSGTKRPPSAVAAPAGGQRTPLGPLSASDRNVRRQSTHQPR